MMSVRFGLLLPALMVIKHWCAIAGGPEKEKFIHTGHMRIRLTQNATIGYFLHKLEQPYTAIQDAKSHIALLAVYSDIHGNGVKVNFRHHPEEMEGAYCYVYKNDVGIQKETRERVTFSMASKGNKRWKLCVRVSEKALIKQNRDLRAVVEKQDKYINEIDRDKRSYRLIIDACLSLIEPAECYFYFHPIDGIVGLAIDRIHDKCAMYQAEWKTIAENSYRTSRWRSYTIKVAYFKKVEGKSMEHFIKLLRKMIPLDPPSLTAQNPNTVWDRPKIVAPPNTSNYDKSWGFFEDGDYDPHCLSTENPEDRHITSCEDGKEKKFTIDFIIN